MKLRVPYKRQGKLNTYEEIFGEEIFGIKQFEYKS